MTRADNSKGGRLRPSRVVADSIQAMSIEYNTMVYEMQRRDVDVTVLSLGEAFFDIPLFSFDDLPIPQIYHYSHSRGIPELREALSRYFASTYDAPFNPDSEIIITAGAKVAVYMSLMSILDPGDEVIILEPAWVSYSEQVKLCHATPVMVPFHASVQDAEQYVTTKTKAIVVNNPQNPTGKVFTRDEISFVHGLAERYQLMIISDEVYSDFLADQNEFVSFGTADREKANTIICNSISKNFGISGWRLGYVVTNAELIDQILKVNQHVITCPATVLEYYVAQHFSEILEITKPQIQEVIRKRQTIARYMDGIGLRRLPGEATFYFFVSIEDSTLTSREFCTELLEKRHVSAAPGLGYGKSCDGFIRVSVGTESMERTIKGLNEISALIANTSAT